MPPCSSTWEPGDRSKCLYPAPQGGSQVLLWFILDIAIGIVIIVALGYLDQWVRNRHQQKLIQREIDSRDF